MLLPLLDITSLQSYIMNVVVIIIIGCMVSYALIKTWLRLLGQPISDEPWAVYLPSGPAPSSREIMLQEREEQEQDPEMEMEMAERSIGVQTYLYPNEEIQLPYGYYYPEE